MVAEGKDDIGWIIENGDDEYQYCPETNCCSQSCSLSHDILLLSYLSRILNRLNKYMSDIRGGYGKTR